MPDDQAGQIEVLNPQGQAGNIPLEQMDDALGQGYKLSKHAIMYDPQGKRGLVPKEQMADAMKAGYQTTPETQFEKERTPKPEDTGFWGRAKQYGKDIGGMATGLLEPLGHPGLPDFSQAPQMAEAAAQRQQEGRSKPYQVLAGGASLAGIDPTGMEESARHGDPGGVLTHAAAQATPVVAAEAARLPAVKRAGEAVSDLGARAKNATGLALRTEKGTLRPSVATVGRIGGTVLGTAAGHYSGIPGAAYAGGTAGALGGRGLMDAIVPKRPFDIPTKGQELGAPLPLAGEFYENRAADLAKRGREQSILDRKAATEAQRGIVAPEAGLGEPRMTGNEGRAATWTNEMVLREAGKGNREAIQQAVRRGLELPPGARYVMGDPDFSRTVYNPKESTIFTPEGTPIRNVENPIVKAPRARIAVPEETRAPRLQGNAEAPPVQTQAVPLGERRTGNGQPPLGVVERRVQSQPVDLLSFNARRELARPDLTPAERSHFEGILADMKAHPESIGSGEQLAEAIRSETAAKPMSREKALANEARRKAKNQ